MVYGPHDDLAIREEVTAYDVLLPIWRYRNLTFALAAIGFLIGILYQFFGTPLYTAQITIAPLPTDLTLSQEGSAIAGLSALSSAVSGSTPSQGPSDFDSFTALIQAPEIAHNLEKDYHVKKYIYSKYWDESKNRWAPENENFLMKVARFLVNKPWHPPTDEDLANYLTKKIDVTSQGPFTVLSLDFRNRQLAGMILGGLVAEAQKTIRHEQHRRAKAAMAYLDKQLQGSPSSLAQQALIGLAIQWEQKRLLAETDLDVGVQISQPMFVSALPTSPAPFKDIAIATILLAFLGIVCSVLLGLFVADDPAVVRRWLADRMASLTERSRGVVAARRYRLER